MIENTWTPREVDDVTLAFPASVSHLIPSMSDIPENFRGGSNEWVRWQSKWFFTGLDRNPVPKDGIDVEMAMRHLAAIQGSFEPKHEHKQAAVAYLASLWFDKP